MTPLPSRAQASRRSRRSLSWRLPLVLLGVLAPCAQAGHGVNPFGTGPVNWNGNPTFVTPLVGRTYREIAPLDQDPDAPETTTDPQSWIFGLNLSTYRMAHPLFIPGIGLGLYMDDGAFAVDLIPKVATLFGVMGAGVGLTVSDGEPGLVVDTWCALFAGLRVRRTWIEETDRTSLSGFVAIPLGL